MEPRVGGRLGLVPAHSAVVRPASGTGRKTLRNHSSHCVQRKGNHSNRTQTASRGTGAVQRKDECDRGSWGGAYTACVGGSSASTVLYTKPGMLQSERTNSHCVGANSPISPKPQMGCSVPIPPKQSQGSQN
ncbi:unnamed protein product, partial [Pleuronectes platessa]